MVTEYKKPLPAVTPITQPFWEGTKAHVLRLQRCQSCGKPFYYARNVCPFCLSDRLEWFDASGKGKVYSFTVAYRPTMPAFAGDVPMVIGIVELEEGPHLTSNVIGIPPEEVRCELPVEAVFEDVTPEVTLVKFKPRGS
jgi:uncharacterized OB-fold protein